jgi:hypothetical protein
MRTRFHSPCAALLGAVLLAIPLLGAGADEAARAARPDQKKGPDLERPLAWLVLAQNPDGSFGEDARSKNPDVATTAIAGIAFLRLGHAGSQGEFQASARRAVAWVVAAVERTPKGEIAVQGPGTLPQRKLGRNIDTYLAAQFLAEAIPTLPPAERGRAEAALGSCVRRIERAQGADGGFAKDGWAPLLSTAFAANGLHAARAAGARVDAKKLALADSNLMNKYDEKTRKFDSRESAGVDLYSAAASVAAAARIPKGSPASNDADRAMQSKAKAVSKGAGAQLSDDRLLRGFGSYGGEEHVSYMMAAEAKAAAGGAEFESWSGNMRLRLAQIQRADGTWRGDHCITSTTFCTAASLITLSIRPLRGGRPS